MESVAPWGTGEQSPVGGAGLYFPPSSPRADFPAARPASLGPAPSARTPPVKSTQCQKEGPPTLPVLRTFAPGVVSGLLLSWLWGVFLALPKAASWGSSGQCHRLLAAETPS